MVGLSFGGMVTVEFELAYPEMVKSLTLVSSGLMGHQSSSKALPISRRWINQRSSTVCCSSSLNSTPDFHFKIEEGTQEVYLLECPVLSS